MTGFSTPHRSTLLPRVFLTASLVIAIAAPVSTYAQDHDTSSRTVYDPDLYAAMRYRPIGPHRGGRVTAVEGFADKPFTFLMGTVGGGVWKTTDAGESWNNISDGYMNVGSVGAISVAPSDDDVIYVGSGSAGVRGCVSVGDGVYKSTDGGTTWEHIGLPEAGQINVIRVHPDNPDLVYVAALGHIFGPNEERGIYRTNDGGQTWEKVLYVSEKTGAIDLVMGPDDPRELYAAMWRAERKPWTMISGGNEGGIYKTTDGGNTWAKLANGIPEYPIGRIGLAISNANPDRVYALIEATGWLGGLYRSDDRGEEFDLINPSKDLIARPWYYMHVDADPQNADIVWVNNERLSKSTDGGRTFTRVATPHGDNHDMWINPDNPAVMIQSNDGGANITLNGGKTWSTQNNQPTAEHYTVAVDNQFPYRVYTPQQDNSTISVPSRITDGPLTPTQTWYGVAGCETGPIAVDPRDPNIIYGGCKGQISRLDLRTGQERQIWVYPEGMESMPNAELRYRFQWESQILISPHNPDVIYHPSQMVHRTTNHGQSWETISPDLTNFEQHRQLHLDLPGGPITHDQTSVEVYGVIFAFAESPLTEGELWAGSDDGLIHVSRDGGNTWNNITPDGLPLHSTVDKIVVSSHQPGRAFAAVQRYRMDDFAPYLYRTDDYGQSWKLSTSGIPAGHPVRSIAEDPDREGLVYAGTEFGLFVSFDNGDQWQSLQLNLPVTPVMDLQVHEKDLIVATQGRSLWILDDLTPLHQLTGEVANADIHLFKPRDAYRLALARGGGASRWAENLPDGAMIFYYFRDVPEDEVTLEVLESSDKVVKSFSSRGEDGLPVNRGMNRFVWNLRYPGPYVTEGVDEGRSRPIRGYLGEIPAVPGTYRVRLTVGEWSHTESFEVRKDPRLETTLAELQEQFDLMVEVRDKITETQQAVTRIMAERERINDAAERSANPEIKRVAESISEKLSVAERKLCITGHGSDEAFYPGMTQRLAVLYSVIAGSDHKPIDSAYERFEELKNALSVHLNEVEEIFEVDIKKFNDAR